jgi:hypothetical protein
MLASSGPIKQRLSEAYSTHLANMDEEQLPKEIRDDYSSLTTCMSCVRPMRGETAVQATVRKMSDPEAGRVAMRIVEMLGTIARLQIQTRPKLRAVNSGED